MAPHKIKWTAEEEAAIRAGISKHGAGKWRTILKDPEFSTVLRLRSNVDLKDKWRNMHLAITGECRRGYKPVQKDIKTTNRQDDKSVVPISEGSDEDQIVRPEPLAIVSEALQDGGSDKPASRFSDCKLVGLTNSKEPSSSMQIKEKNLPPPNLERFPWGNIKSCTADGKLNKQGMEYDSTKVDLHAEVDAELMRIRQMSPEDAAAAAAKAVEKAAAAIAEAEEAEKEAVEAERAAEEAKAKAEELQRKLREKKANPAPKRKNRGGRR